MPKSTGISFPNRTIVVIPAKAGIQGNILVHLRNPCAYILASSRNGTLYVGVTSNLGRRISEHKSGKTIGFAKQHGVTRLVYVELHETMEAAITREKQIKKWNRKWKLRLIESVNPRWNDLTDAINR